MAKAKSSSINHSLILYEDRRVVVIATGIKRKSENPKTGSMIQTWVLRKDQDPWEAVKTGADSAICGDCPLRKDPITGKRSCYVAVYQAPKSIWKAYRAGRYAKATNYDEFSGRFVRFGAYGEPVLIPLPIVKAIAAVAKGWTGYTHQWRSPAFSAYKTYFMASCSEADYQAAQAAGWRTFTVSRTTLEQQVICPASKEAGHRVSCADCRLCAGTSRQARSIQIQPH